MTTTDPADRLAALKNRGPAAATAKVVATGAALALTGVLVAGMGIDRSEPAEAAPPAPQIVVIVRQPGQAAPAAVPAPAAVAPTPVATTSAS